MFFFFCSATCFNPNQAIPQASTQQLQTQLALARAFARDICGLHTGDGAGEVISRMIPGLNMIEHYRSIKHTVQ